MLFIPFWYFQKAGSSIVGCPDVTPSAVSYVDNGVTWCYWLKSTAQSSIYQEIMCATNGGTLANIPSAAHETVIKTALGSSWTVTDNVYIGVTDATRTGNFQTWAGDSLTYTNWASTEPQSSNVCVYMERTSYEWYTTHCNDHLPAVCYCVIDPLDSYTCSGTVVTSAGGVTNTGTTVQSSVSNVPTTSPQTASTDGRTSTNIQTTTAASNVCYPSSLTSCLSCCYAQTTTTTSSIGASFMDIVADLKIDIKQTNKFQRKLHSIADHRPLSVSIGTVAIFTLISVIAVIVTCDVPVLCRQWNMLRKSMRRLLCRRPKSRVARNSRSIHPGEFLETTTHPPSVSTS
ncbi:probable GPI-anchored adhesin-like protein PGA18 [Pecten maximus]|uniref:probable GPI-anchored adhesin-like protein PGA18 n=1 Tax=Pecten maximus TaxID=6579 RepID=UPI00145818F6|nr:probable GPI-anchored adhesin-like protein PGA18 [Pecten maximus]